MNYLITAYKDNAVFERSVADDVRLREILTKIFDQSIEAKQGQDVSQQLEELITKLESSPTNEGFTLKSPVHNSVVELTRYAGGLRCICAAQGAIRLDHMINRAHALDYINKLRHEGFTDMTPREVFKEIDERAIITIRHREDPSIAVTFTMEPEI
jgi:uncharacterized membrane-anchored protein YjiN (DUF445 family)